MARHPTSNLSRAHGGSLTFLVVIVGFAAYFCLENIYRVAQSHYLQQIAPGDNRATLLSVVSFVRSGYSIISLPILGFLSQGGRTNQGFILLMLLQALAAAGLYATAKHQVFKPVLSET